MVEMGMGQEDMIDARQIRYRQVPDPGTGIDQDIVVDEQRRGPQMLATDAAATAEDSQFHRHLVAKVVTPSPSSCGRLLPRCRILSGNMAHCPRPGDNPSKLYNFVPALAQSLRAKPARDLLPEPWFGMRQMCLAGLQAHRLADEEGQVLHSATNSNGRRTWPAWPGKSSRQSREAGWLDIPSSHPPLRRQALTPSSILMPAISTISLSRSRKASPPISLLLTVGNVVPSTWVRKTPSERREMTAT